MNGGPVDRARAARGQRGGREGSGPVQRSAVGGPDGSPRRTTVPITRSPTPMNTTHARTGGSQFAAGHPASATTRADSLMLSATRAASTYPSQSRLLSAPQLTDTTLGEGGAVEAVHPTNAAMRTATSAIARRARSGRAGELRVGPVPVVVEVRPATPARPQRLRSHRPPRLRVVKVQVLSRASALPAASFTPEAPPLTVAR